MADPVQQEEPKKERQLIKMHNVLLQVVAFTQTTFFRWLPEDIQNHMIPYIFSPILSLALRVDILTDYVDKIDRDRKKKE
jgi:hypothetical protein